MRSNSKGKPCKLLQYHPLNSLHTYRVPVFPIDEDRILFFACPQERTEREEADRKRAEAAKRQEQVDEEQQQKVTMQFSAVLLFRFLDTFPVHFFPIDGDRILLFACPQERTEREEAGRKRAEAAKRGKQVDEEQQQKVAMHFLQYRPLDFVHTDRIHFFPIDGDRILISWFLHVRTSASNGRRQTERRRRQQGIKSKCMRSNSRSSPSEVVQ